MQKRILVTGSAGFIGFHLTKALIIKGFQVVGVDNLNDYYEPLLKRDRLNVLERLVVEYDCVDNYRFVKLDISDTAAMEKLFHESSFDIVINLAAQAGVRYSLENPKAYIDSNVTGFANILECCRHQNIEHLLFASSSSVYGLNKKKPFAATDNTDYPISLYAATKKSNELLAHSYSHLFDIPCTGLRFFTVYGPFGRPDMAYYGFTESILNGIPIKVFNNGNQERDFTYIDDIITGILGLLNLPPMPRVSSITGSRAPFDIFNIGNNDPISLRRFIQAIESAVGKKAVEVMLPAQPGDVTSTYADIDPLIKKCGFKPTTEIEEGIKFFVDWYVDSKCSSGATKVLLTK